MAGNITSSSKGNRVENNGTEDVEDDVDKLPDSYFDKDAVRVFDKIDNGKAGILPLSKVFELIETLEEGFESGDFDSHMWKVDLNESGRLDFFAFVRWYVVEEVSLDSVEEADHFVS